MSNEVKILVGTMTGTAELVADEIVDVLDGKGADVEVLLMDDLKPDVLKPGPLYILCVSTYGQGDVPDNAQAFFAALSEQKPDLSGIYYGVFALGDRTYMQTFCFGGQKFDELLSGLGATRLGDRKEHDACSGELPEDLAAEWAEQWFEAAAEAA
ncbi:nitric oxide synthase [Rhodospirillaceae bacterium KN72]|uniref:Nitric oxide synthase n=1 Tax=Pacificispira spongiicola TaxID=2729598 RepID=A0A7Y0E376_9PROT|nr:flavodoxin domain-containing protein [Pacificispira spongiicola]NMM46394.1 nitric oxide synthase [Pacificispira spongiicola]